MERDRERGAAAVEFALVLPVLLLIVLAIIDFGHGFMVSGTVAAAARAGAREMAISGKPDKAKASTVAAFGLGGLSAANVTVIPTTCAPGVDATVRVDYTYRTLTGFFGAERTAHGQGVMRCGG